jgi:hypothetical protein
MSTDQERIKVLERQVQVLFAMVRCNGQGMTAALEALGIDPYAATRDLDDPEGAAVREWQVTSKAERLLRDT